MAKRIDRDSREYKTGYQDGSRDGRHKGREQTLHTLRNRLAPLLDTGDTPRELPDPPTVPAETSLYDIGLLSRVGNMLRRQGWHTIADVLGRNDHDLLDIYGFGPDALNHLDEALAELGYDRRQQPHHPQD